MNNSWHPDCFCCDICQAVLADVGFVKNAGRYEGVRSCARSREETSPTSPRSPSLSWTQAPVPAVPQPREGPRPGQVHLPEVSRHHRRAAADLQERPLPPGPLQLQQLRVSLTTSDNCPPPKRPPFWTYLLSGLSCTINSKELTADARELKGELYCLPCHDKMGVPICGACRRPIEGRVVNAMGKQWHVEVCEQEWDYFHYARGGRCAKILTHRCVTY